MKHISVKQVGPVVVLKPRGNLMGGNECDELRMAAEEAGKQGPLSLVIDLQGVEYINSSGIGELVGLYTSYKKRGGGAVLANLHKKVKDLLVLLHLVRVFDIYESEEEAVASFAAARPEPQAS